MHALSGLALAALVSGVLLALRRSGRIATGPRAIGLAALAVAVVGFLLAAALVPITPVY